METFSEKNVIKSCVREDLGEAVGRAGVGERCRREFIVFQSRRGLEADLSMRLALKERLAEMMSLSYLLVADLSLKRSVRECDWM